MREVIEVSDEINARIKRIEELCAELDDAGNAKASATADYDLAYAKAMARLAMGKVTEIDGEPIGKVSVTLIPKYAAGICYEERALLETASNKYKSLATKIDTLAATLNAKQSIMRHLAVEVT